MNPHICPWWLTYTFDNPLRTLLHNPAQILGPYVSPSMTVADIGCGFGYFSIGLARLVETQGVVISVDIQQKMLEKAKQRARRAGVEQIIQFHRCSADTLTITQMLDFALAFWMAHEVVEQENFFRQIHAALKPDGLFLMVEPFFHVSATQFSSQVSTAEKAGLKIYQQPKIGLSHSVLMPNNTI